MFGGTGKSQTIGYHLDDVYGSAWRGPKNVQLHDHRSLAYFSLNHKPVGRGGWSGGGRFKSAYSGFDHSPSGSIMVAGYNERPRYAGRFVAFVPPEYPFPIAKNLDEYGASLYNRARPTNPEMDLANALYELKDLPRMLKQRFEFNGLKDVFDFNLAVQFGWLPLLSDTRNFYQTHKVMHKRLQQLLRDNGKPVRRRVQGPKIQKTTLLGETTGMDFPLLSPLLLTSSYGDSARNASKEEYVESLNVWFSGRFRFWLPKGDFNDWRWTSRMMARIYGLRISPGVVYNAIPWSWLLDWFTNAGDAVSNLDAGVADRLISDYAYVMGDQQDYLKTTSTGCFRIQGGGESTVTASAKWGFYSKERISASPFGFALNSGDPTPYQLSILASLAGSRR